MNDNLWLAATFGNLAICLALWKDRRCNHFRCVALLQVASVVLLFLHNLQLNFGEYMRYHYSWQVYDYANVMWQISIYGVIVLRGTKTPGKLALTFYVVCLGVTYQEYQIADDSRRELANHIFWIRQWISTAADWMLAFAIYTDSIGNPDKEKHRGRTPD